MIRFAPLLGGLAYAQGSEFAQKYSTHHCDPRVRFAEPLVDLINDRADTFGTERSGLGDWLPYALEYEIGAGVSAIRHALRRRDMCARCDSQIGLR